MAQHDESIENEKAWELGGVDGCTGIKDQRASRT